MTEPRLAIAIPAYGHPEWTARHLRLMAAEASRLNVAFYVSDDTPDNSVEKAVLDIAPELRTLHYRRNTPGLGHDRNLLTTLAWPKEEYVWLLRSAMWAKPETLEQLLAFLQGQDLVFVNSHSDDHRMIPFASDGAARELLREALWHQTLTGATIYHRRVIDWASRQGEALPVHRNFPQLSVMMGYASTNAVAAGWFGERCVNTSFFGHSYWRARAIDVFVNDWAAVVTAFPTVVPPAEQARIIGEHSRRMRLFDAATMMELRRSGQFNWASLLQPHFMHAMHLPRWKLLALLALPPRGFAAYQRMQALRRHRGPREGTTD
jgi:hypothetical protein